MGSLCSDVTSGSRFSQAKRKLSGAARSRQSSRTGSVQGKTSQLLTQIAKARVLLAKISSEVDEVSRLLKESKLHAVDQLANCVGAGRLTYQGNPSDGSLTNLRTMRNSQSFNQQGAAIPRRGSAALRP
jgi:hypothetical protein